MAMTVTGVVKDGLVVPSVPLPEGATVEIMIEGATIEVPDDLREEFEAWERASSNALALVERLAAEDEPNEAR